MTHQGAAPEIEPPTWTVPDDRPCVQCGYSLRGLDVSGNCPECGMPLVNSVRGAYLRFSDPSYLARLHLGVKLIEWGIPLRVLAVLCSGTIAITMGGGSRHSMAVLTWLAYIPAYAAAYLGWWLFTSGDPALAAFDPSQRLRRAIRATILVAATLTLIDITSSLAVLGWTGLIASKGLTGLAFLSWITRSMIAVRYCLWLARRGESENNVITAQALTWALPLLATIGSLVLGLGALVALALYFSLLDDTRSMLRTARLLRERHQLITTPPAGPPISARPSPPAP